MYHSPTNGGMSLIKVAKTVSQFINQDSGCGYRLIVGTDSQGLKRADFVTAIIIYRIGAGGRYFWKRIRNEGTVYHNLRERIYKEVSLSLETAQKLLARLDKIIGPSDELKNYDFQIHIDVGQHGPTREIIKEVVGMVRGNGFEAKIKPESFAASNIADKHV